jgi:hypothetical protein
MTLRQRPCLVSLAVLASALVTRASAQAPADDDPILRALVDECARSMTLELPGLEKPYFIQYSAEERMLSQVSATCGAIVDSDARHQRSLVPEVRVGSYELDNTNFSGGGEGFGGGRRGGGGGGGGGFLGGVVSLPLDDDALVIRQAVWLATDRVYKSAIETLTQKRAYLKDREHEDRAHDFQPMAPVQVMEPRVATAFDRAPWEARLRQISQRFLQQPLLQDSHVALTVLSGNDYLVNSEGSRLRAGVRRAQLVITAEVQADDGERLSDQLSYLAERPEDLPAADQVIADIDRLVANLTRAVSAPVLKHYLGPVLFDGVASPQLFQALIARGAAGRPDPVGGGRRRFASAESLDAHLGKRILPRSMQVFDDPRVPEVGGVRLAGHYAHDDEGVAPQRVDLVVDGVLKSLVMSRTPTKDFQATTGHGRRAGRAGHPQATVGCLQIEAKDGRDADALKEALLDEAKDLGLEFALRVSAIESGGPGGGGGRGFAAAFRRGQQRGEGGGSLLGDPLYVTKVYVKDGHEEPVRGCEFGALDVSNLRKILAAGNTPTVYNQLDRGGFAASASIIAPAVIVEEVELAGIEQESERKPLLPAPNARTQ